MTLFLKIQFCAGECGQEWGVDNNCPGLRPNNARAQRTARRHFRQHNCRSSLDLRAFPFRHFRSPCPCLGAAKTNLWLDEDVDGSCVVPRIPVVPDHPPLWSAPPRPSKTLQGAATAHATFLPGCLRLDVRHVLGGVGHLSADGRQWGLGGTTTWAENKVCILG